MVISISYCNLDFKMDFQTIRTNSIIINYSIYSTSVFFLVYYSYGYFKQYKNKYQAKYS